MNTPATKPTSLTDKVLAIALVVWLLFFGGFGTLTKLLKPSMIAPIATTIGQGAQQLLATAQVAAPSTIDTRAIATPARAAAPAAAARPIVAPAAAPAAKAIATPVAPAPTATPAIAAQAPAVPAEVPAAAIAFSVPEGQHTDIHPDGSFTIDGGATRYYPDSNSVIVDVRLAGSEDYLKRVTEVVPTPTAVYIAPTPSFVPCAGRHGCPKP